MPGINAMGMQQAISMWVWRAQHACVALRSIWSRAGSDCSALRPTRGSFHACTQAESLQRSGLLSDAEACWRGLVGALEADVAAARSADKEAELIDCLCHLADVQVGACGAHAHAYACMCAGAQAGSQACQAVQASARISAMQPAPHHAVWLRRLCAHPAMP